MNYKYFKFVLDRKRRWKSENTQLDAWQYRIAMSLVWGPSIKVIKVNTLIFFYTQIIISISTKFQCNIQCI